MNRFMIVNELLPYDYCGVPFFLFEDERCRRISFEAKLLYSMLYDRMKHCREKQWYDAEGAMYLRIRTRPAEHDLRDKYQKDPDEWSLTEIMGQCSHSVRKQKDELIRVNLLKEVREGLGRVNRLYLMHYEKGL